jgi:hypothetical protein
MSRISKGVVTLKKLALCFMIVVALVSLPSFSWLNKASSSNSQTRYKNFHVSEFNLQMQLPETTSTTGDYFGSVEVLSSTFLNDQTLKYWVIFKSGRFPTSKNSCRIANLIVSFNLLTITNTQLKLIT